MSNIVSLSDRRAQKQRSYRQEIKREIAKSNSVDALRADMQDYSKRQAEILDEVMARIMSLEEKQLELAHYLRLLAERLDV